MLMARWILFLSLVVMLALDGARSYHARTGYAQPTEMWQPETAVYADLRWPPGSDVQPGQPLGARVFAQRCAVCHGPDGRGNGPAAPSMIPRPRDFSLGLFKYKSTLRNEPPTDQDLRQVVTEGLPASAMAAFGDLLTEDELAAVVAEVKRMARLPDVLPSGITVPPPFSDPNSAVRGRDVYAQLNCAGCHGLDGRKVGHLQDAKGYPVLIRDLTAPWTFRGGSDAKDIWLVLTTGLAGSAMPSYADAATASERWDLVHYLQSIARVPPWQPGGRLDGPGQRSDLLKRGEYLVRAQMCGLCHTQINRTGIYRDDKYLAGGMRVGAYPHAQFVSANLTSDAATGLGRRTEEQIMEVFRSGHAPDRVLNLWGMPWFYMHYLNSDDARAIARYLKSQPPVRNAISPPLRYGVLETVAAKIVSPLPAANPTVITFGAGNFGNAAGPVQTPSSLLIGAQWIALAFGAVALIVVIIRERRWPGTRRGRTLASVALFGVLVGSVVVRALYDLPALSVIPPEQLVAGATAGISTPDTSQLAREEREMVARGQYLFTVASCAFCHDPDGSGGSKVSWRPFGTLWVRNITSDTETGIGAWSDAAIARAIRSGISRDGRALHWQGMIWDHASNWDEEDIRSLIAYLRRIPPVRNQVPAPRPPADDDCEIYTFWIASSTTPGCH